MYMLLPLPCVRGSAGCNMGFGYTLYVNVYISLKKYNLKEEISNSSVLFNATVLKSLEYKLTWLYKDRKTIRTVNYLKMDAGKFTQLLI